MPPKEDSEEIIRCWHDLDHAVRDTNFQAVLYYVAQLIQHKSRLDELYGEVTIDW